MSGGGEGEWGTTYTDMSPRKIDNRRRPADFIQGSLYNHGQHTKVSIIWSYFDGCIVGMWIRPEPEFQNGPVPRIRRRKKGSVATLNNCEIQNDNVIFKQKKDPAQKIWNSQLVLDPKLWLKESRILHVILDNKVKMCMRSSRVVRASSDYQCQSRNCPGFDPSILRHNGIWGPADETVLKYIKNPQKSPCNTKVKMYDFFMTLNWTHVSSELMSVFQN